MLDHLVKNEIFARSDQCCFGNRPLLLFKRWNQNDDLTLTLEMSVEELCGVKVGSFSCFLSVTKSQIRMTHYNFRNDFIIWIRQTCKCLKPN